ncbi:hypothetical protein D908_01301, partial [Vibrio mimicus CAIM 602]
WQREIGRECEPESIGLNKWFSHWTQGLEQDDLSVVVFPNDNEEGVILFPDEFDFELKKLANRR